MKNHKRKLKRKKKLSKLEKFNLWLESHKLLAFFVDFTVYLVLVGIVSIVLSQFIPLPPLPEQKRIVAKIEELLKFVDILQSSLK